MNNLGIQILLPLPQELKQQILCYCLQSLSTKQQLFLKGESTTDYKKVYSTLVSFASNFSIELSPFSVTLFIDNVPIDLDYNYKSWCFIKDELKLFQTLKFTSLKLLCLFSDQCMKLADKLIQHNPMNVIISEFYVNESNLDDLSSPVLYSVTIINSATFLYMHEGFDFAITFPSLKQISFKYPLHLDEHADFFYLNNLLSQGNIEKITLILQTSFNNSFIVREELLEFLNHDKVTCCVELLQLPINELLIPFIENCPINEMLIQDSEEEGKTLIQSSIDLMQKLTEIKHLRLVGFRITDLQLVNDCLHSLTITGISFEGLNFSRLTKLIELRLKTLHGTIDEFSVNSLPNSLKSLDVSEIVFSGSSNFKLPIFLQCLMMRFSNLKFINNLCDCKHLTNISFNQGFEYITEGNPIWNKLPSSLEKIEFYPVKFKKLRYNTKLFGMTINESISNLDVIFHTNQELIVCINTDDVIFHEIFQDKEVKATDNGLNKGTLCGSIIIKSSNANNIIRLVTKESSPHIYLVYPESNKSSINACFIDEEGDERWKFNEVKRHNGFVVLEDGSTPW